MTASSRVGNIPATMPAAVIEARGATEVVERPVPVPGPGEVLVEVDHCGICGTDLHYLLEWGPTRSGAVEGHEWAGTVVKLGEDVEALSVGDRVLGGPGERCGVCSHCRAGRPSLCIERGKAGVDHYEGAFARYKLAGEAELLEVPDGMSSRHAALTEPLAVSLHAISRAGGAQPDLRWLITGGGPIGYLAVAALAAEGVADIVVSEPHEARRSLCERLGASTVSPDQLASAPELPMDVVDEPFHVALECSGRADAMEAALGVLDRGATLVLVGSGLKRPRFDPNRILLNELVVTGANTYDEGGFEAALALLASGRMPLDELVEPNDYGLDQLMEAAEALSRGELARKVMISPRTTRHRGV